MIPEDDDIRRMRLRAAYATRASQERRRRPERVVDRFSDTLILVATIATLVVIAATSMADTVRAAEGPENRSVAVQTTRFQYEDGSAFTKYDNWARLARVAPPTSVVTVRERSTMADMECADAAAVACVFPEGDHYGLEILRVPDVRDMRVTFWHEMGHVYDFGSMTDEQRQTFLELLPDNDGRWFTEDYRTSPHEMFARTYAACAILGPDLPGGETEYAEWSGAVATTIDRHSTTCNMIGLGRVPNAAKPITLAADVTLRRWCPSSRVMTRRVCAAWLRVAQCETGGRQYTITTTSLRQIRWRYNGPSKYDGALQFGGRTWRGNIDRVRARDLTRAQRAARAAGSYRYAYAAPPAVQILAADALRRRPDGGLGQWPVCGARW